MTTAAADRRIALDLEVEVLTDADTGIPELVVDNDEATAPAAYAGIIAAGRDLIGMLHLVSAYEEAEPPAAELIGEMAAALFDGTDFHTGHVARLLHQAIDRAAADHLAKTDCGYTPESALRRMSYDTAAEAMPRALKGADDRGHLARSLKAELRGAIEAAGLTRFMFACGVGHPEFNGTGFPCRLVPEHDGDHEGGAGTFPQISAMKAAKQDTEVTA